MGVEPVSQETFAMDPAGVSAVGTQVEQTASGDLGSANIYNGQLGEHIYGGFLPSIIQESIRLFGGNYTSAYIDILNQRVLIGKGLQNAADAAEANELQISNAFHTDQGSLPTPSTYVAPATPTPTQTPEANPPVNPNPPLNTIPTSPAAPGPTQPDPTSGPSPTP